MALVSLETYYAIPNIHAGNNSYSPDEGTTWFPILLSTGSYCIDEINDQVEDNFASISTKLRLSSMQTTRRHPRTGKNIALRALNPNNQAINQLN